MPAKNVHHSAVREALIADGWTITADPLGVFVGARRMYVDLGAEQSSLAAERDGSRIAIEIQSFLGLSPVEDLHQAVGQYVVYRAALRISDPERVLFLAVPEVVYTDGILGEPLGRMVAADVGVKVLVYEPTERRVVEWKS